MADAALVGELISAAIETAADIAADPPDAPLLIQLCRVQAYLADVFEELHADGLIDRWRMPHVHIAPDGQACIHTWWRLHGAVRWQP